jgi:nicotinamide-nucleotide amidase
VGTVCFAWGGRRRPLTVVTRHFAGDRVAVRRAAVNAALLGLLELAESPENSRLSKG